MVERQKRLNEVYEYLRKYFGIHTQTDFAGALKYSRSVISAALNGKETYLTDKLFKNICEVFPGVFSLDYLLAGEGSLLTNKEDKPDNAPNQNLDWQQIAIDTMRSQMADLRMQLVDKQNVIEAQQRTIELLNMQIQGMRMEMKMKGLETFPFEMGVAEQKYSSPDKI